ncbi:MAG: hypothetical protein M0006_05500 [Magnetospirillum sp.]|nr:hypothetical protein [Magnetospirillum sp.]
MVFDILATIGGVIADQADAEQLAREMKALVVRAETLGCVVEIRDVRLGRELEKIVLPPRGPRCP